MKNYIIIVLMMLSVANSCKSATPSSKDIVAQFYTLLLQDASPSEVDEKTFFADDSNDDVYALLKSNSASASKTVMWDYLRLHKDIFITNNLKDNKDFKYSVSTPFQLYRKNGNLNQTEMFIVSFANRRVSGTAYDGLNCILFTRGAKSYLNVGYINILSNGRLLFDIFYNDVNAHARKNQ